MLAVGTEVPSLIDDRVAPPEPRPGIIIVTATSALLQFSSVMVSSAVMYAEYLGGSALFSGLTIDRVAKDSFAGTKPSAQFRTPTLQSSGDGADGSMIKFADNELEYHANEGSSPSSNTRELADKYGI
ncbi:hypothetical protein B0H19DRAFT_1268908 [Mycena capillaripes]|nr:hypothetical protein B0H19DRAFT_1268908 [Mycena capillaripes]